MPKRVTRHNHIATKPQNIFNPPSFHLSIQLQLLFKRNLYLLALNLVPSNGVALPRQYISLKNIPQLFMLQNNLKKLYMWPALMNKKNTWPHIMKPPSTKRLTWHPQRLTWHPQHLTWHPQHLTRHPNTDKFIISNMKLF